jgi:hypothetical protein
VLSVPVTPGAVVMPGEPVARIASGGYFLRLALPERLATELREGGAVEIGTRGPAGSTEKAPAPGRIARIYPEITEGRVIADVEVEGIGTYFVGERTLVRIPVATRTVIAVPLAALTLRHGIDYVRIAGPAGPQDVAVIPGERFGPPEAPMVAILSGLAAGERVLTPDAPK